MILGRHLNCTQRSFTEDIFTSAEVNMSFIHVPSFVCFLCCSDHFWLRKSSLRFLLGQRFLIRFQCFIDSLKHFKG